MTQQQAHQWLWVVAFFAFLSIMSIVLTLPYLWKFILMVPYILIVTSIGVLLNIILIIGAFAKRNWVLFFIIIIAYINSMFGSIHDLYQDMVDPNFSFATVGFVPGLFTWTVYVLTDVTGLAILILRSIGYIKEKRAGLQTSF